MADRHIYFRWNVDIVLMELLHGLRLPVHRLTRLYNAIQGQFDQVLAAVEAGESWPIQLIDRRYATWPGAKSIFDAEVGDYTSRLPGRSIESVGYDLAELSRRKGGTDATGTEGRVAPECLPGDVD